MDDVTPIVADAGLEESSPSQLVDLDAAGLDITGIDFLAASRSDSTCVNPIDLLFTPFFPSPIDLAIPTFIPDLIHPSVLFSSADELPGLEGLGLSFEEVDFWGDIMVPEPPFRWANEPLEGMALPYDEVGQWLGQEPASAAPDFILPAPETGDDHAIAAELEKMQLACESPAEDSLPTMPEDVEEAITSPTATTSPSTGDLSEAPVATEQPASPEAADDHTAMVDDEGEAQPERTTRRRTTRGRRGGKKNRRRPEAATATAPTDAESDVEGEPDAGRGD